MARADITIDRPASVSLMTRTATALLRTLGTGLGCAVASMLLGQGTFVLNDTTFLQRDVGPGSYHAVYIVPASDPMGVRVKDLVVLTTDGERLVSLQVEDLRSTLAAHCPPEHPPLADAWVPVYPLAGASYTYTPCDKGYSGGVLLREGYVVEEGMEGPTVALAKVLEADGEGRCAMRWYTITDPKGVVVSVRPVDKATGLCLWTYGWEKPEHRLMIPASKAHRLPRVVNHCTDRKWAEHTFDPVDPALYR
jgi:hypothetical protein